ncbi:hypothetical protein R1flu_021749 [Riccia fluitans]|uniref:Uncharacterized protein n=1 Tax=Riccia fluitans TaxID=41844 RepID=A0ABD1ZS21_9MARC
MQTYYVALYFVDITGRNSRVLNAYLDGVALNRVGDNDANSSFPVTANETFVAAGLQDYNATTSIEVFPVPILLTGSSAQRCGGLADANVQLLFYHVNSRRGCH